MRWSLSLDASKSSLNMHNIPEIYEGALDSFLYSSKLGERAWFKLTGKRGLAASQDLHSTASPEPVCRICHEFPDVNGIKETVTRRIWLSWLSIASHPMISRPGYTLFLLSSFPLLCRPNMFCRTTLFVVLLFK